MLKQARNLILSAIIICFLSLPSFAITQDFDISSQENMAHEEIGYTQNNIRDTNVEPMNTESIKKSVIPDPVKEGKKVIGLFLKTLVAVGFSALVIYVLLFFIKKYYPLKFGSSDCEEYENLDLSTPDNKNDALKSFLNRTK